MKQSCQQRFGVGVEQLLGPHGIEQVTGPPPAIFVLGRSRQPLHQDARSCSVRYGQNDPGLELLGLFEIGRDRLGQAVSGQRHDTLPELTLGRGFYRHCQHTATAHFTEARDSKHRLRIKAHQATKTTLVGAVGQQQAQGAGGPQLQADPTLEFDPAGAQRGDHQRLAQ